MHARTWRASVLALSWLIGFAPGGFAQDRTPSSGAPATPAREIDVSKRIAEVLGEKNAPSNEQKEPRADAVPPPAKAEPTFPPPQVFRHEKGYFEVLPPADMAHWWGSRSTSEWMPHEGMTEYEGIAFIPRTGANKKFWKLFHVHRFEKGLTVDFLRSRMAEHVASLTKAGREASGPQDVAVGADGALGVGCSWVVFRDREGLPWPRTYEDVWVIAPTGTWNVVFAYEDPLDRWSLLQMRNSFRFLVPKDADGGLVFPLHPTTARVSECFGLRWDGKEKDEQCGWAAGQFAQWYLGCHLPYAGPSGVKRMWRIETPGFRKVPNGRGSLPPPGALLLWDGRRNEPGHIAVVLAANPRNRWVRVIDCNARRDRRGHIREVSLNDRRILGWLVRE